MWSILFGYLLIMVVMFVLDAVWLGWIAKRFYRQGMSRAVEFEVRWWAALLFYLIHGAGTYYFGVSGSGGWGTVAFHGFFFGLVTYGTYNLTNLATVRNWPVAVSAVDLTWGSLITMLAALAAYAVA